jgi:hypothetical protein
MAPRAPSLHDKHDYVDGVIIGDPALDRPDPDAPDWRQLRYAEAALRECAMVVAYVADAEERRGFSATAEHYRRIWRQAGEALPVLRRLGVGSEAVPPALLDEVRLGVDRLLIAMDSLVRFSARDSSDTRDETGAAKQSVPCNSVRSVVAS